MRTAPRHAPENRLLLAIQFWKGDQEQAMRLMRFIADLQPGRCDNADILFVARFDCPQDGETIAHVSKKFNVHTYTSRRRGTGWPSGCNELWHGTMDWCYHMIEARKVPAYKAILTFEADCVPLTPHWINVMSREWDAVQHPQKPVFVYGPKLLAPGEHINGNCLFSGNLAFLHWIAKRVGGAPPRAGWDYAHAADFRRWGAKDFTMMRSYWASKTFTKEQFDAELNRGTIFVHGIKDDSLLNMSRAHFLT